MADSAEGSQMMCTISDIIESEECRRAAQWVWQQPVMVGHPVFLCNFHAKPSTASAVSERNITEEE